MCACFVMACLFLFCVSCSVWCNVLSFKCLMCVVSSMSCRVGCHVLCLFGVCVWLCVFFVRVFVACVVRRALCCHVLCVLCV